MLRFAVLAIVAACGAQPKRPTVTGAALYTQVQTLQQSGRATVGTVEVRREHIVTSKTDQVFFVEQLIAKCKGGDASAEVECTLALLLDQRFTLHEKMPDQRASPADPKPDQSSSMISSGVVIGLGVAAIGGLTYGVATCEFEGCKAVFGVPLALVGGAALLLLLTSGH